MACTSPGLADWTIANLHNNVAACLPKHACLAPGASSDPFIDFHSMKYPATGRDAACEPGSSAANGFVDRLSMGL